MGIKFEVTQALPEQVSADLLVLPCLSGPKPGPGTAQVAQAMGLDLAATLRSAGFDGEAGDAFWTLGLGTVGATAVLFVGLGDPAALSPGVVRRAAMSAAPQIGRAAVVATTLPAAGSSPGTGDGGAAAAGSSGTGSQDGGAAAAAGFAEGLLLGGYRFSRYKRQPADRESLRTPVLRRVLVLADPAAPAAATAALDKGLRRGEALASLTNWARDLVNTPPRDATPAMLAEQARQLAQAHGLDCTIRQAAELAAGGFGGILGVGQGSRNEPVLAELRYRGGGDAAVIGLTGKGITFDSGGLTLKRTTEIEWMKADMAGAASIMAVLRGAAEFGLAVNIDAVLPFAENMPGGSAQRPGDVLTHRGGKTSEVRDTDCEGRLLVADALAYLAERKPAVLADVATLTDAAGLGDGLWAVLGSDAGLAAELVAAGEEAGDPGWPLPLPPAYRRHLESQVADVRNCPGDAPDSTVLAAMYLQEFTAGIPWLHIDNGSTAYLERPNECWPEGATGSPARALLRWLERRARSGSSQ